MHDAVPPRARCRRVDEFYSSWRMRPVKGRDGGIATEVVLQHFEEMGIQHDLAKLAVRRGMWCVRLRSWLRLIILAKSALELD